MQFIDRYPLDVPMPPISPAPAPGPYYPGIEPVLPGFTQIMTDAMQN